MDGAGKYRGGSGTCWEVEPLDKPMDFITFGEGRHTPAAGAAGAFSRMVESKVGRIEINRGGKVETIKKNVIEVINPGERAANMNPGGGGYGNPLERNPERVLKDVLENWETMERAYDVYGVVLDGECEDETLSINLPDTEKRRAELSA